MRLLVSVRSAAELGAAVAGGADLIDAKEPTQGSLGPVSPEVLAAIARALAPKIPLSIALGDPGTATEAAAAVSGALAVAGARTGGIYLKLGLAGARNLPSGRGLLEAAVQSTMQAAARSSASVFVIAVAYADHAVAGAPARHAVSRVAAEVGAHGILLDTWRKDGRDLFHHVDAHALREWIEESGRLGLLVALAGSLGLEGVRAAAALPADVVGVRGAACAGGRSGEVQEQRVRALRRVLREGEGARVAARAT